MYYYLFKRDVCNLNHLLYIQSVIYFISCIFITMIEQLHINEVNNGVEVFFASITTILVLMSLLVFFIFPVILANKAYKNDIKNSSILFVRNIDMFVVNFNKILLLFMSYTFNMFFFTILISRKFNIFIGFEAIYLFIIFHLLVSMKFSKHFFNKNYKLINCIYVLLIFRCIVTIAHIIDSNVSFFKVYDIFNNIVDNLLYNLFYIDNSDIFGIIYGIMTIVFFFILLKYIYTNNVEIKE